MMEVIVWAVNLTTTLGTSAREWRAWRGWRIVALVAGLAAVAAVVSTYRVFNAMYDEPAHIGAGMEWLSRGTYTYEPQHPPLSRIAAAIVPWLSGERGYGHTWMYNEGRLILGEGAHYERTLALARLGELPFFLILLVTVWLWARRLADERVAALAVVFAAANPNLLAHAGIAGTDIGPAAMMPAALLGLVLWLESPTIRRSLALGILVAVCGLTKFNAIAYWIPAAIGVAAIGSRVSAPGFALRRYKTRAAPIAVAVATAALVTWAVYRFSIGAVGGLKLPAPEFWIGLRDFFKHTSEGHPAYLLGHVRVGGWWYYDLVTIVVKTPVPLMLFGAIGGWMAVRHSLSVAREANDGQRIAEIALPIGIASIVLVASATRVDIGVRLLLAIYPLLSVLAARGITWAWERARSASSRFAIMALFTWTLVDPLAAHPDHIAYFNVLAGPNPAHVLVDSNLDWGQDLYRLRETARDLRIDSLRVHYFGTAEFTAVGLERTRRLRPNERAAGWVAASETFYAGVWSDTSLYWLRRHQPVAHVGKSIRLYYIRPDSVAP